MRLERPARILLCILPFISIAILPWAVSVVTMFIASLIYTPIAIIVGISADLLYYPGHGVLWGTCTGLAVALFAASVRHFVKTRIM